MLLTFYGNERLYNVQAVKIIEDTSSFTVELGVYLDDSYYSFYAIARKPDDYLSLVNLFTLKIEELLQLEVRSKTLNKNLYISWRSFIMALKEEIEVINCEIITDLGYVLDMVPRNCKSSYKNYKDYTKFLRVRDKGSYFFITSIDTNVENLYLKTNIGEVLSMKVTGRADTLMLALERYLNKETETKSTTKEIVDFVISEKFSTDNIKLGINSLSTIEKRIKEGVGFIVKLDYMPENKIEGKLAR